MNPSCSKKIAAFTLIELLASMAILLLLMGIIFGVFNQASKAWILGGARTDSYQGVRLAMEMIARELEGAVVTNNSPTSSGKKITFLTVKDALDLLAVDASPPAGLSATPPNDQIFFVSNASDSTKKDDVDLTEYAYFVVFCTDDTLGMNRGHYYLLRNQTRSTSATAWTFLDDPVTWSKKPQISSLSKVPILENVLRLELSYEQLDPANPTKGTKEVNDWSSTPDLPPLAVHITLCVLDARAADQLAAITGGAGLTDTELAMVPYQIEKLSKEGIKNTLRGNLRTFYRTVQLRTGR